MVEVISNSDQNHVYPNGLGIASGYNKVPKEMVQRAVECTEGSPDGFRARCDSGVYELRKLQVAVSSPKQ
jgi:hypothetical protein